MKLDENVGTDDQGKYALLNLRKFRALDQQDLKIAQDAYAKLVKLGVLEQSGPRTSNEFFAIKLKDKHAAKALEAYAQSIEPEDAEFAQQVRTLVERASQRSIWCKAPD